MLIAFSRTFSKQICFCTCTEISILTPPYDQKQFEYCDCGNVGLRYKNCSMIKAAGESISDISCVSKGRGYIHFWRAPGQFSVLYIHIRIYILSALALNQWRRAPGLLMFQESSRSVFADRKCKLSEGRAFQYRVEGKETKRKRRGEKKKK